MEYAPLPPYDRVLIQNLIDELHAANQERSKIPEVLISCNESARFLGVTRATISRWIREHRLQKHFVEGVTGIWFADLVRIKATRQQHHQTT